MSVIRLMMFFGLMLLAEKALPQSNSWVYINPFVANPTTVVFDWKNKKFYFGDLAETWVDCSLSYPGKEKKYETCVKSPSFQFGAPRNVKVGDAWEIDGTLFEVKNGGIKKILGRDVGMAVLIEDQTNGIEYFYSPIQGLIGILQKKDHAVGVLLLEGNCGLGAVQSCYEKIRD